MKDRNIYEEKKYFLKYFSTAKNMLDSGKENKKVLEHWDNKYFCYIIKETSFLGHTQMLLLEFY